MIAKNKTTENENSVTDYLDSIAEEQRKKDCSALVKILSKQSGFKAKMWGHAIVGFGSYHYKYESGREGDAPLAGFASRSNSIALYFSLPEKKRDVLLKKFGKHKTNKGCIHIKTLADIDIEVLNKMVDVSIESLLKEYPSGK